MSVSRPDSPSRPRLTRHLGLAQTTAMTLGAMGFLAGWVFPLAAGTIYAFSAYVRTQLPDLSR